HELNGQMSSKSYSILTRYGIIKERTAALMTDAVRANLLECCGYKTQILEFVDLSHTPKNLLIRATKGTLSPKVKEKALEEVRRLCREFELNPTLYDLLKQAEYFHS
ncbi:MAG: SAM-dependent methyltransferase, partial [Oscillospiraceae bacterium]